MPACNGGCDILADPTLTAVEADIYWLPALDSGSVILTPAPPALRVDKADREALAIRKKRDAFIAEGSTHHLHDLGKGQRLHVVLPVDGATDVAALIPLGPGGFGRMEAVSRLLASLHGRAVPPDTRLTRQQRTRIRRMLQAADGERDGATQLEIARAIFRIGKLTRDEWQVASARHVVARLLRDARALIAGGYRKLLRHRRRS